MLFYFIFTKLCLLQKLDNDKARVRPIIAHNTSGDEPRIMSYKDHYDELFVRRVA